jgi:hypothetical protein
MKSFAPGLYERVYRHVGLGLDSSVARLAELDRSGHEVLW